MLDIHYYPQAENVYSDARDPAMRALRIRSVRSLWDKTYRDESWIANTGDGPEVKLIPRMKDWIAQCYPGTKLTIGEWSFGAEGDIEFVHLMAIGKVKGWERHVNREPRAVVENEYRGACHLLLRARFSSRQCS